jgi:putative ABC transport system permease protein
MVLGWLQLRHKPLRLLVALSGIAFAVLLIMMQLGFRSALFESAVRFHERFDYDIALFSPDSVFIVRPQPFSIRRLYQTLGFDAVQDVTPVYIFPAVWKNPWTHRLSPGSPAARPGRFPGVPEAADPPGRGPVRPRLAA